jgi:hypothetical protein
MTCFSSGSSSCASIYSSKVENKSGGMMVCYNLAQMSSKKKMRESTGVEPEGEREMRIFFVLACHSA